MSTLRAGFAKALREIRNARGKSQEDFSEISSRTYLSILERGVKSPTLDKVEMLADALDVHPVTMLAMSYVSKKGDLEKLLETVQSEAHEIARLNVERAKLEQEKSKLNLGKAK